MTDDIQTKKKGIHIGLIPDGNRRYASKRGKKVWEGHSEGVKRLREFTNWCLERPEIRQISIFALSTENVGRPEEEVRGLWKIYEKGLKDLLNDKIVKENRVRIRIIGDDGLWKPGLKQLAKEVINSTKHYSKNMLNIMLAYGSKFEVADAIKKMAGKPIQAIDNFLLVKDPLDLLIRTGNQYRLSNFMLLQASYAEIYFSKTLWPEFSKEEFEKILRWYYRQQKRWGK